MKFTVSKTEIVKALSSTLGVVEKGKHFQFSLMSF